MIDKFMLTVKSASLSSYSLKLRTYRRISKYKLFSPCVLEPTIYRTRDEHANQYTTDAVLLCCNYCRQ